jgi:hypothetical protein
MPSGVLLLGNLALTVLTVSSLLMLAGIALILWRPPKKSKPLSKHNLEASVLLCCGYGLSVVLLVLTWLWFPGALTVWSAIPVALFGLTFALEILQRLHSPLRFLAAPALVVGLLCSMGQLVIQKGPLGLTPPTLARLP